ncbi:MAG: Ig-like domain-containing protein [Oscillospiraceae bacterium]|nr:Ig-like domain-containing protein [Oscillospiraceae bacterium]
MFLSDQTVFKGTTRWDGKPVIAEAFVLIGIDGTNPTTSAAFVTDTANQPKSIWLPATATVAAGANITLAPVINPYGVETTLTWDSATVAKATVDTTGKVTGVAAGTSVITVTTANGLSAQCTVTVTSA